MGWLEDLLKEVPLSAVLKERVALAEQKFGEAVEEAQKQRQKVAALEEEIAKLRAQLPPIPSGDLSDDTCQVLVYLFRAGGGNDNVGALARHVQVERGIAQYHLDLLRERGLARRTGGNYVSGLVYWGLTPDGRRYVVENGLLSE